MPLSIQGRLYKRANFWLNELDASSFVREIMTQGYRIPFIRLPWPVFKSNHRSALEHCDFVSSAIVCSPLSVVAEGKLRLVLDLRYISQFLPEWKFRYEGLGLGRSGNSLGDSLNADSKVLALLNFIDFSVQPRLD